jgi:putative ABC transport system permease protein
MSPIDVSLLEVLAALALVAVAVVVSLWQRVGLEGDIGVAVARSFVQLTAIGFVIDLIFEADTIFLVAALVGAMALFGALTARHRARQVPGAFLPLLAALSLAGGATLFSSWRSESSSPSRASSCRWAAWWSATR